MPTFACLAVALVFTAGAYGISKAGQRAGQVTSFLAGSAVALGAFVVVFGMAWLREESRPAAHVDGRARPATSLGYGRPPAHVPVN